LKFIHEMSGPREENAILKKGAQLDPGKEGVEKKCHLNEDCSLTAVLIKRSCAVRKKKPSPGRAGAELALTGGPKRVQLIKRDYGVPELSRCGRHIPGIS